MRVRAVWLSLLIWLSAMVSATAWSRAGHELVARIAWERLDEAGKGDLFTVLRQHPAFRVWEEEALAAKPADFRLFIVERAAAWPDDMRRKGDDNPFRLKDATQVHGDWHYVDHPLSFDGTPCPKRLPEESVLKGLRWGHGVLSNPRNGLRQRAIALAWLLHLVGDVHQPLHCSERFSQALKKGDRGGNAWMVAKPGGREITLHWMWDSLADDVARAAQPPLDRKTDRQCPPDTRFDDWSEEGAALARRYVYDEGSVPGAPIVDEQHPPRDVSPLSPSYIERARQVAANRLALAGRRLGDLLRFYWPRSR